MLVESIESFKEEVGDAVNLLLGMLNLWELLKNSKWLINQNALNLKIGFSDAEMGEKDKLSTLDSCLGLVSIGM